VDEGDAREQRKEGCRHHWLEKRNSGHVVQITTSLIENANSHVPSVLASLTKGGLSAATKSLAIE
jgi:hypothetical protein